MVYNNDGPIYSMLTSKVVNGVVIASVPSDATWDYVLGQTGYPTIGQYFCGTGGGTLNKGVKFLSGPPWYGDPCNCSESNNDCSYGDMGFYFLYAWPLGDGVWTGWGFAVNGSMWLAFKNSQSSTIPIGGWYNWIANGQSGPGQQNPTLATNFVLTPF